MKIELKKVKTFPEVSQDSLSFTADVWVDGKKAGYAHNDGWGGPIGVYPDTLVKILQAHAASLPPVQLITNTTTSESINVQPTVDTLIGDLINTFEAAKEYKRLSAKHLLFKLKDDVRIFQSGPFKASDMAFYVANPDDTKKTLEAETVLNCLQFEEAVKLFRGY